MSAILRRSFSLRALPVLLVVGLYALFARGVDWRGEWLWTVDWATGTTVLLAPLVAGLAALEAREAQEAQRLLFDSTARRRPVALVPLGLGLLTGLVCFLVVMVVAIVATLTAGARPTPGEVLPSLGLLVLGALSLGVGASFGAVLGRVWPSILAAPIAAAVVFAAALAAGLTSFPAVLRLGGSTGTLAGLTVSGRFVTAIGSLAVLHCATLVLGLVVRSRVGTVTVGGLGAAALVLAALVWSDPPQDLVVDESPPPLRCSDTTPVVCLAPQTDRLLDTLPADLARESRPLQSIGAQTPARFTQVLPGRRVVESAPLYLESFEVNHRRLVGESVRRALTVPAACPQDTRTPGPPEDVFSARATIEAWLAIRSGAAQAGDFVGQPDHDWLTRTVKDQASWVRSTYAALSDCDFASVRSVAPAGDG